MKLKFAAAFASLPLLAACAPEIESSISIADAIEVLRGAEAMNVPAILRVPQSSEDGCKSGLENLIANLGTLAPVTGKGQCIEKDGDQLAEIETQMVLVTPSSAYDSNNLFVLTVLDHKDEPTFELQFGLTRPLDEIVKVLATNSDELQVDFDPAKFIFTLTNDTEAPILVMGNTVFLDKKPSLPGVAPVELAPLSSTELVFSDVASVYAEVGNPYVFATIETTEP